MAFLRINEWTIPIADRSVRIETDILGSSGRGTGGAAFRATRKAFRRYRMRTGLLTNLEATALRGMLLGTHQTWTFEAPNLLNSTKGVAPNGGAAGTSVTTPRWGSRKLVVNNLTGIEFPFYSPEPTWAAQSSPTVRAYSCSYWIETTPGSGTWTWYCLTYDGTTRWFSNGATLGAAPSGQAAQVFYSQATTGIGRMIFFNNLTTYNLDSVVCYPYRVPDAWVNEMYSLARSNPHDSPKLWVDGNILSSETGTGPISMVGEVHGEKVVQATIAGVWEPAARELDFSLTESL